MQRRDVVLDSVNMAFREEDSIFNQLYEKQIFSDLYFEDLIFLKWLKKMHI